jgi:hypothetical protein
MKDGEEQDSLIQHEPRDWLCQAAGGRPLSGGKGQGEAVGHTK